MGVLEAGGAEMGQEGLNYECTIKLTSKKSIKYTRILNYKSVYRTILIFSQVKS